MKRLATITMIACTLVALGARVARAQEDSVLIPSQLELTDAQQADLHKMLDKKLLEVVKTCVASYPRPEFFTTLSVQFELKKSGDLRGGYVPAGVVDSNMYVASDEERAKKEEEGSFARLVVRSDRDVERCLKKGTRKFDTDFDRYWADVSATYTIAWKGKTPKLTSTAFEVAKKN